MDDVDHMSLEMGVARGCRQTSSQCRNMFPVIIVNSLTLGDMADIFSVKISNLL